MKSITTAFSMFTVNELKCKGSGVIKIDPRFAQMLTIFREIVYQKPITPTSVCRSPEHNRKVNGNPRSLHLTDNPVHKTYGTAAIDCYWADMSTKDKLEFASLAYNHGFSVGLHNSFCHLDLRVIAGLVQNCFIYGDWDNSIFTSNDVVKKSDEM